MKKSQPANPERGLSSPQQRAKTGRPARSAGFQTCCIADFQVGRASELVQPAGLETRDTAGLETCATTPASSDIFILSDGRIFVHNLTPALAALLLEFNPQDELAIARAKAHA